MDRSAQASANTWPRSPVPLPSRPPWKKLWKAAIDPGGGLCQLGDHRFNVFLPFGFKPRLEPGDPALDVSLNAVAPDGPSAKNAGIRGVGLGGQRQTLH